MSNMSLARNPRPQLIGGALEMLAQHFAENVHIVPLTLASRRYHPALRVALQDADVQVNDRDEEAVMRVTTASGRTHMMRPWSPVLAIIEPRIGSLDVRTTSTGRIGKLTVLDLPGERIRHLRLDGLTLNETLKASRSVDFGQIKSIDLDGNYMTFPVYTQKLLMRKPLLDRVRIYNELDASAVTILSSLRTKSLELGFQDIVGFIRVLSGNNALSQTLESLTVFDIVLSSEECCTDSWRIMTAIEEAIRVFPGLKNLCVCTTRRHTDTDVQPCRLMWPMTRELATRHPQVNITWEAWFSVSITDLGGVPFLTLFQSLVENQVDQIDKLVNEFPAMADGDRLEDEGWHGHFNDVNEEADDQVQAISFSQDNCTLTLGFHCHYDRIIT